MEEWIRISRGLLSWEWYHSTNMVRLFLHFLLRANTEDVECGDMLIKRGQFATTQQELCEQTGLSRQIIRSCIEKLMLNQRINQKITNHRTIITICGYDSYIGSKNDGQPENNQRFNQPSRTYTRTNMNDNSLLSMSNIIEKEDKEEDNINNKISSTKDKSFSEDIVSIARDDEEQTILTGDFFTWWNLYDKKVGREACMKKWLNLTKKEQQACIDAAKTYVASTPDKKYRKNPLTYLNQKSWNDEIIISDGSTDNRAGYGRQQQRDYDRSRRVAEYAEVAAGFRSQAELDRKVRGME